MSRRKEVRYFIKRLRNVSERNKIKWDEWDDHGLNDVASVAVEMLTAQNGADMQIINAVFKHLVAWNSHFQVNRKVMIKFITDVQESLFCGDYEESSSTSVLHIETGETDEMIEMRRQMMDEHLALRLQEHFDSIHSAEPEPECQPNEWQTASPKRSKQQQTSDKSQHLMQLFPHIDKSKIKSLLRENANDVERVGEILIDFVPEAKPAEPVLPEPSGWSFEDFVQKLDEIERGEPEPSGLNFENPKQSRPHKPKRSRKQLKL